MQPLPDGAYEAMVIEVSPLPDGRGARLELALLAGPHRGEVVHVRSPGLHPDDVTVLGAAAKLRVVAGVPGVRLAGR